MVYIVYKTTNLVNRKIYIGVHRQSSPVEFDGYLGSGHVLLKALKRYGRSNFERTTLFAFDQEKIALAKEMELVNEEFIKRDDVYNVTVGGSKPPSHKGRTKSIEHRQKIGAAQKGKIITEEAKIKIRIALANYRATHPKRIVSEETRAKHRIALLNRGMSKESRQKCRGKRANISGSKNPCFGKKGADHPKHGSKETEDTKKRKRTAALENQPILICPTVAHKAKEVDYNVGTLIFVAPNPKT